MKAQIKINTTAQDFIITLVKTEITGCMRAQLGGGYSRFQVTGMIKWGQKSQHQKIARASNKTPQTYLDQNPTQSQKFHTQKTSSIIPFTWNLAPPPQCMVITQVTPRAPLPVVLCELEDPSVNCKSQVLVRLASWKLIAANSLSIDTSIKGTPH